MQTLDTVTLFRDDFVAGPQSDELAPAFVEEELLHFAEKVKEVAEPELRSWKVAKCCAGTCWKATKLAARTANRLGCFGTRQVSGIARAIRWASEPRRHKKPESPTPGLMLEFVLIGIHIVLLGTATLLA